MGVPDRSSVTSCTSILEHFIVKFEGIGTGLTRNPNEKINKFKLGPGGKCWNQSNPVICS